MSKPVKIIYSDPNDIYKLLGLGYETIALNEWVHEPNVNYVAIGPVCYDKISRTVPLGLRGANFYLVSYMNRVGLNDGSNYVFSYSDEIYVKEALDKVNNPDFEKVYEGYNPPECEYILDIDSAVKTFEEFTELPKGTWFGYDYESKSFPDTSEFIITGLGIATTERRVWIDYRFCMSTPRGSLLDYKDHPDEGLKRLNEAHRKFLEKHGRHCVVFNVNFELMATYRYLGDFFDYRDLNVVNVMKQYGLWCNLKWTSRLELNINSWDDEFDEFNKAFDPNGGEDFIEFDEEGNVKSLDFGKIKSRFSWLSFSDIKEMKEHYEVCKNSFYIMPSNQLGYYCTLDAYNTLMCWIKELPNWNYVDSDDDHLSIGERIDKLPSFPIEDRFKLMSEAGLDIYCDGKIAGAIVNNGGQILDEKFWRFGYNLVYAMCLHAETHLGVFYFKELLEKITEYNDINDYSPLAQKFIKEGVNLEGYSTDPEWAGWYLGKTLFTTRYYDEGYEGYCNTNLVYEDFGQEVGDEILGIIWNWTDSLWNIGRKKNLFNELQPIIDRELALTPELMEKHTNTVLHYDYLNKIEWYKSMPWYNTKVTEFKEEYTFEGKTQHIRYWYDDVAYTLNVNTTQNDIMEMILSKYEDDRLYCLCAATSRDEDLWDFYPRTSYEDDRNYFFSDDAVSHLTENGLNRLKEVFNGEKYEAEFDYVYKHIGLVNAVAWYYEDDFKDIIEKARIGDFENKWEFFIIPILLRAWAKYYKIRVYFEEGYYGGATNYKSLDKYWMDSYEERDTSKIEKALYYPEFIPNYQFSGRWSSGFHTIPSRNEVKKCTSSPDDSVFTYFDISSMEVRGIAYLSRDPKLIELFETHQDVYKYCARFMLGDEYYDSLTPDEVAEYRSEFKVVLLAYYYLRGARSLAPELGKTVEETQEIMDSLAKTFPESIKFRDYLSHYPLNHDGFLLTPFKEWIVSDEEPYRQLKHGINTVIQGATAVMLVYGFFNLMKQTWKKGWKFRSVGYVHDSSQSYFDIRHLWEMRDHYYEHVTQFLYDRFRVRFDFDIMTGCNYYEVSKLSQIAPDIIELKGCANSINSIMQRLQRNNIAFELVDREKYDLDENGLLKPEVNDSLVDFITSGAFEAKFKCDYSSYKVQLRKL
jgi:hypothetical protein